MADLERIVNRIKSKTRSRVEHVFAVVKRQFGFSKVRYKGLAKNATSVRGTGFGEYLPGAQASDGMSAPAVGVRRACGLKKGRKIRLGGPKRPQFEQVKRRHEVASKSATCSALP